MVRTDRRFTREAVCWHLACIAILLARFVRLGHHGCDSPGLLLIVSPIRKRCTVQALGSTSGQRCCPRLAWSRCGGLQQNRQVPCRTSHRIAGCEACSASAATWVSVKYILACRRGSRLPTASCSRKMGARSAAPSHTGRTDAGGQVVTWQAPGSAIPAHRRAVGSNQTCPVRYWRWAAALTVSGRERNRQDRSWLIFR
jgi:hypothetical protein